MKLVFLLMIAAASLALAGCGGAASSGAASTFSGSASTGPPPAGMQAVQHIIFMAQENRSFDHYFGKLNGYRASLGVPGSVDGLPPNASNPNFTNTGQVAAYHLQTMCVEDLSPAWDESHRDFNRQDPSSNVGKMDGFVYSAANFAINTGEHDVQGLRAMGYYDSSDLPYYYFMASQFPTSDRWFSPVMSRTQPNRMYFLAATSEGYTKPPTNTLKSKTIFHLLQQAGVSWKIYVTNPGSTYLTYFQPFATQHAANIVPLSEYFHDVAAGTLPSVALIESGYESGQDEHPQSNIQVGANFAAQVINAFMGSTSWKDSAFILTFDEGGGFYDHVPPQPMPNPDGIPPIDLKPTDTQGNFDHTGFRVPLIVISPFAKKNYVSHTVADYTAILKFIETRFSLPNLNRRDAAQMDMTEFFDFKAVPWANPPAPPPQPTSGPCYFDHLP